MLSISEKRLGELVAELEQLREANETLSRAGVHLSRQNMELAAECDQLREELGQLPAGEFTTQASVFYKGNTR